MAPCRLMKIKGRKDILKKKNKSAKANKKKEVSEKAE